MGEAQEAVGATSQATIGSESDISSVGATSRVTGSNGSDISSGHGLSSQKSSERRGTDSVPYVIPCKNSCKIRRIGDYVNNICVSTKLCVHDQTWHPNKKYIPMEMGEERVAYNIRQMKHYRPGEEEEEKRIGVSTKLKLFSYPWNITKTLTKTDLSGSSRLLLSKGLVEKYIIPFLNATSREEVMTRKGLRVTVWDFDTNSSYNLVFKRWSSSDGYVFINNWNRDFNKRRRLVVGDQIGMCWDSFYSNELQVEAASSQC